LATTVRLAIAAGGCATRFALEADAPRTLLLVGATTALELTGAAAICCAFTATADLATACELTKLVCETAVTPPGAVLFTYLMFVLLTVVLFTVVLLIFVTWLL